MRLSPDEQAILNWIVSCGPTMIETVQSWSAVNSGSRNLQGLGVMAGLLEQAYAPLGGQIYLNDPHPVEAIGADGVLHPLSHGRIFHLSQRPEAPIRILLSGHMDTVFPVDHPFQTPAWKEQGLLNGPGVADMKGGLLIMLYALMAFEKSPWASKIGYDVIINADEEVSSLGSAPLLQRMARKADLGLVYEPSLPDGTLAGARKGIGSYTAVARGRSAHAGRNPEQGRNAVLAMSDLFLRLSKLTGAREGLTVNVACMEGGGPTNVVPDLAIGRFEIRCTTHEDRHWAEAEIRGLLTDVAAERDVSLDLHGQFNRPPKPMDVRQAALFSTVKLCAADLDLPLEWRATGGCCDGNNLAAEGLAVVDTLGARGGAIHSPDEFLLTESLVERAQLSALLLMRLASGAMPLPPRGSQA